MSENILIEKEKHRGKHIAIVDTENPEVVGEGETPEKALSEARRNGHEDPVLLYIPEEDSVHIY